jgi:hypothetical protein
MEVNEHERLSNITLRHFLIWYALVFNNIYSGSERDTSMAFFWKRDMWKSLTINGNQSMQISVKREISKYLSVKRDFAKF